MTAQFRRIITSGPAVPMAVLTGAFIISLTLFVVFRPDMDGRVFFYPDNSGLRIAAERRGIPLRKNTQDAVEVFLGELFIGPVDLQLERTAPRGADVQHVVLEDRILYIGLDNRFLKADDELPISFDEALDNITYNIKFNFPRIAEVVFTVEGSQVYAPYYPLARE